MNLLPGTTLNQWILHNMIRQAHLGVIHTLSSVATWLRLPLLMLMRLHSLTLTRHCSVSDVLNITDLPSTLWLLRMLAFLARDYHRPSLPPLYTPLIKKPTNKGGLTIRTRRLGLKTLSLKGRQTPWKLTFERLIRML